MLFASSHLSFARRNLGISGHHFRLFWDFWRGCSNLGLEPLGIFSLGGSFSGLFLRYILHGVCWDSSIIDEVTGYRGSLGNLQAFGISAEKKLRRSVLRSFLAINSILIVQKKFWCVVVSWFVKYKGWPLTKSSTSVGKKISDPRLQGKLRIRIF